MQVGERIKQLRKKNKLTQEELANKLGLKKVSIQKYENGGIINFKKETLEKLAEILEVSPAYIMGWQDFDERYNLDQLIEDLNVFEIINRKYGYVGVEIANLLDTLNEEGKRKVLFYAEDIVEIPKYNSDVN